jgi:hypothetical protein
MLIYLSKKITNIIFLRNNLISTAKICDFSAAIIHDQGYYCIWHGSKRDCVSC